NRKSENFSNIRRVFCSYRFFAHLYKSLEGGLGHAHQGVVHPTPPSGTSSTQRSAQTRARETRKPRMPRGGVPTTSERIGSSRGLGQWEVHPRAAARDWLLGTLR